METTEQDVSISPSSREAPKDSLDMIERYIATLLESNEGKIPAFHPLVALEVSLWRSTVESSTTTENGAQEG